MNRPVSSLSASEARFRALLEAAPDALVIVDGDGRIVFSNAQVNSVFGYTSVEVSGQPVEMLLPERFRGRHIAHRSNYTSDPKTRPMGSGLPLFGLHKGGREFPVEISLSPWHGEDGVLILAAIRDITDRKAAEAALDHARVAAETASRELEAFSYSVAHDLRAPLRGMHGFAQILVDQYGSALDADGQDALHEILLNAKRMGSLIDGLLTLARLSRSELKREPVNFSALARRQLSELAAAETNRDVHVVVADGLVAEADPVLARALLDNLLGNAWKFTSKTPVARIDVGSIDSGGRTAFFVKDNGAGFDMTYAKKLFAPFQRLHSATEFAGTGIGLATVQRIMRRHGGTVWAEGAIGGGATFYFSFSPAVSGGTS
jgi:PAS domain S-box-containing protein